MTPPVTPMVKLKPETHRALQEIARSEDISMGELVGMLVSRYERERYWRGAQEDLARLREEPAEWDALKREAVEWDTTVADGLDGEEPYYREDSDS